MLELKQRVGILAKDNQLSSGSIFSHQMKKIPKQTYKVKNWREYNKSLKKRGSLTFWIDREVIDEWENKEKTGRRGPSNKYSDLAIETMLTIKVLYGLPGRQAEGFLESLFKMMDIDLSVPDHSTLSRRQGKLKVDLPIKYSSQARHIVVDSTVRKVFGEGEWVEWLSSLNNKVIGHHQYLSQTKAA